MSADAVWLQLQSSKARFTPVSNHMGSLPNTGCTRVVQLQCIKLKAGID